MLKVPWRLGIVVTLVGSIITAAFWAGDFSRKVANMRKDINGLSAYSQTMGLKVDVLMEREAADDVGDRALEKRLEQIERVLVRIENLLQRSIERNRRE